MSADEYRIEYSIQRRGEADEDFAEIGFGSSGSWADLDACLNMVSSAVQRGEWETEAET